MKALKFNVWLIMLLTLACRIDNHFDFPDRDNCIRGHGTIVSETRSLSNFHSIDNTIFADILLSQGPQEAVLLEAQDNVLELVKTQVVNGELRLASDRCLDIRQPVKVHVTIPEIKNLTVTGVGDIIAQDQFDLTELIIILRGVGNFQLQGNTASLNINLTGNGKIKAFGLNAGKCKVRVSGVGDVEVYVNDELDVTITGVGTVYYKGDPSITSNISGSGDIVNAN